MIRVNVEGGIFGELADTKFPGVVYARLYLSQERGGEISGGRREK